MTELTPDLIALISAGGIQTVATLATLFVVLSKLPQEKTKAKVEIASLSSDVISDQLTIHNNVVKQLLQRDIEYIELNRKLAENSAKLASVEERLAQTEKRLVIEHDLRLQLEQQLERYKNGTTI